MGVWNGWGYGIAFFRALNFQISEPRNFWDFPEISATEKYFSDSGKCPFHTPPIHTPTKWPAKFRAAMATHVAMLPANLQLLCAEDLGPLG